MTTVQINFRTDPQTRARLKVLAAAQGLTMQSVMERLVCDWLKKSEKK